MNQQFSKRVVLWAAFSLVLLCAGLVAINHTVPLASAQSDGGYDLTWSTVDGGGYTFSTGDGYSLGATIGQPDAGVLSGDDYTLTGGFWGGATPEYRIYLPVVVRQ